MNSGPFFADFFAQLASDDIFDDWRRITRDIRNAYEKTRVQRIICRVSCNNLEMYQAGKEVEALNPAISAHFPQFLIKFMSSFQSLPFDVQTPLNTRILLKLIDFSAGNCQNPKEIVNFDDFQRISRLLEMAGNVIIKDLLEMAVKLYPDDGKQREIGARDLLDGVVLSEETDAEKFQEEAFLKMKHKLMSMAPPSSTLERRILDQELLQQESHLNNCI